MTRLGLLRRRLEGWLGRPLPEPPPLFKLGVGSGDWHEVGRQLAGLLIERGGLARDDRVLDLGCGLGRVVQPLRRYLSRRATYLGIDVSPHYIAWNRDEIEARDPRFRFAWLDVKSEAYHSEGGLEPEKARFPSAADSFDFAIATSLFTHLDAPATERYLAELARVLRPGGRLFATFFLLDEKVRQRMRAGQANFDFRYPVAKGGWTAFPKSPDQAIAFEREWLLAALERAGLRLLEPIEAGQWSGAVGGPTYQNLLLATRR